MNHPNLIVSLFAGHWPGADSPEVLPVQPEPITTMVNHCRGNTAVVRLWNEGDTDRCRLCPREHCRAVDGVCLIVVEQIVSLDDAAMLDTTKFDWKDDSKPAPTPKPWTRR